MYKVEELKFSKLLTAPEIKQCRKQLKGILIAPFNENKAKGIGYNLSCSDLLYSTKKGSPLRIHYNEQGSFVYIKPNDTILILSYEYIKVDGNIAGTFHSRVRTSASGLGNISTTLDPMWNGMLLISINNPTKKPIKLQITENKDGKIERCNFITLVVFQSFPKSDANSISLQLDNPPMRADIWTELTAPTHKFLHNGRYHKFQSFIQNLVDFKVDESDEKKQIKKILNIILKLKVSLGAQMSMENVKKSVIELDYEIPEDYFELREKLDIIKSIVFSKDKKIDDLINNSSVDEKITLMKNECEYMILSNEVEQINLFVHKNIEEWWDKSFITNIIYEYFIPNVGALLGTVSIFGLLMFGLNQNTDSAVFKICLALLPTIISFVINYIKIRKDKK